MLKGRSLLTLKDYSEKEIDCLLKLSIELKQQKKDGIFNKRLENKNVALIFEKPSTRTRCAFTVACADEGAHPEYLGKNDIQLGHKESVEDTARVLGRMFDAIQFRGFSQKTVELLAKYSNIPVYNGLTDEDHPTQVLADLMTILETKGRLKGIRFCFTGDGRNNMANALMIGAAKMGMDFCIVAPNELSPDKELFSLCQKFAVESGGTVSVSDNINALENADIVYTDVWYSMGEEDKAAERIRLLTPYRIDEAAMTLAKSDALFMHCLPAVKGKEVTEDVFEGTSSIVFEQAENRLHTIKAVMVATLS